MLVKVAIVQHRVGEPVGLDLRLHLFRIRPDFVCFPEYWGAEAGMRDQTDLARRAVAQKRAMARLSADLKAVVIGGTIVERSDGKLHNVARVYDSGRPVGLYAKRHPTEREMAHGIVAGEERPVWDLGFARVATAICADCLEPATFDALGPEEVDFLFVPNASPHRPGESPEDKFERDETIFVAGARRAGAYVIKCCGVGTLFGGRLQGRSLVAAPWGIVHRVPPTEEDRPQVITADLSLDELREFRAQFKPRSSPVTRPLA
jgi:predicted amidohydrolase